MTLLEKYNNWKNAPARAPISLKNIWAVIQSLWRRKAGLTPLLQEQVDYRRKVSDIGCKASGVCRCGCSWEELIYADKSCEGSCYPPIKNRINWEIFKLTNKDARTN